MVHCFGEGANIRETLLRNARGMQTASIVAWAERRGLEQQAYMPRTIRPSQSQLLWGLAAARCSFPDCRKILVDPESGSDAPNIIGEQAHIVAYSDSPNAPRFDRSYPTEDKNKYENLILLCPTHHRIVDKRPSKYTVNKLHSMKREHENWVRMSLQNSVGTLNFQELEAVTEHLLSRSLTSEDTDLRVVPPMEKIKRNNLSAPVDQHITMGLANAKLVEDFVNTRCSIDPTFAVRLRTHFVTEYNRLSEARISGNDLFFALVSFASRNSRTFNQQAAGLTVLTYLFEKCEVFEK